MKQPSYSDETLPTSAFLIDGSLGTWRMVELGADGYPSSLKYFDSSPAINGPLNSTIDCVFQARVSQVDTASDIAFLDLGGGKTGALNLRRAGQLVKGRPNGIADCVTEGQKLIVQALADPSALEIKAIPVTPRPRLAGRYCVIEMAGSRLNFSKDLSPSIIGSLKDKLSPLADHFALIVRSGAADVSPEIIINEATYLSSLLLSYDPKSPSGFLFALSAAHQALIALDTSDTPVIAADGTTRDALASAARDHYPQLLPRIVSYTGKSPLFEAGGAEEAIAEALSDQIHLPSGGWISFHETPAMTVVDVNMGTALQGRPAAHAKRIVNLEAVLAVAHHLKFQDIGGLIIVDFINMNAKGSVAELMHLLDEAFLGDLAQVQHTGMSNFGLVEIARKRRGVSLHQRMMVQTAPYMRIRSVCDNLLRRANHIGKSADIGTIIIEAPERVIRMLMEHPDKPLIESRTSRKLECVTSAKMDVYIKC